MYQKLWTSVQAVQATLSYRRQPSGRFGTRCVSHNESEALTHDAEVKFTVNTLIRIHLVTRCDRCKPLKCVCATCVCMCDVKLYHRKTEKCACTSWIPGFLYELIKACVASRTDTRVTRNCLRLLLTSRYDCQPSHYPRDAADSRHTLLPTSFWPPMVTILYMTVYSGPDQRGSETIGIPHAGSASFGSAME